MGIGPNGHLYPSPSLPHATRRLPPFLRVPPPPLSAAGDRAGTPRAPAAAGPLATPGHIYQSATQLPAQGHRPAPVVGGPHPSPTQEKQQGNAPGHWSNLRCTTSVWSIVAYIFHHFLFNLSTRFSAVCEGQLEQLLIDIMVWHWHYDMSFDYFCLWSISRCSPSYLHICFPLLTIYSGIIDATLILLPELHVCSFFSQVYFAEHSSAGSQGYSRCH